MSTLYFKQPAMSPARKIVHLLSFTFSLFLYMTSICSAKGKPETPFLTSSVGNFVWDDADRDGRQDPQERGVGGVEVRLIDANNQVIITVQTDASGHYTFTGINTEPAGKVYQILFKLPAGYLFSVRNASVIDSENSDADETTGKTNLFTLVPGQVNNDIDAGLIGFNGTLPLHRLNLSTTLSAGKVLVSWEAENELNTALFVVQRSINGIYFSDITSKPPVGPVNTPTTYQVTDDLHGVKNASCVYYRIKAMDSDGRVAYSRINMVKVGKPATARFWPLPFTDKLTLDYYATLSTKLKITMVNAAGHSVKELDLNVNPGHNQISFSDMDRVAAGVYFIRIYDSNLNLVYTSKISK
jgi:hypothetical protein